MTFTALLRLGRASRDVREERHREDRLHGLDVGATHLGDDDLMAVREGERDSEQHEAAET